MRIHSHRGKAPTVSLPFVLLCLLLAVLWLMGGASRADVSGQLFVRGAAWVALIAMILFAERPALRPIGPVAALLLATVLLPVIQLVPLPPDVWQMLPGRGLLAEAANASGQAQPWRPLSIVPGATFNALSSLVVPVAVFVLLRCIGPTEHGRIPGLVLATVFASTLVGLLQFSAGGLDNPFVNDSPGEVAGTFANRNHFALLLAMGCLITPVWAFLQDGRSNWRMPAAIGLLLLFVLTIMASGSRAGLALGSIGVVLGLIIARRAAARALRRYPRWVLPALIAGVLGMLAIFVLVSIAADRAVSIQRVLAVDAGQDMRARGLPTVLTMVGTYFPVGSGLGGFDPIFRMHEPFELLKFTYFNHAHNDFIEIVLDAGVLGLFVLAAAICWWAWRSMRTWRSGFSMNHAIPRLGSATLLLVLLASGFDYPARTPLIMALVVIAAMWLEEKGEEQGGRALPNNDPHL